MNNVADSLCRLEYGGSDAYRRRRYAECFCSHIQREEVDESRYWVSPRWVGTSLLVTIGGYHWRLGIRSGWLEVPIEKVESSCHCCHY